MIGSELWSNGRTIRAYDGMRTIACCVDGAPRVALVAEPTARHHLDAIAAAHAGIESPYVAPVSARGEPFLMFDCDAVTDLETLATQLTARGTKVSYAAAIAFNEFLMDSIESVHAVGYLGALGWRNVLVGSTGRPWLFGAGHNFPVRGVGGALLSGQGIVVAPEVMFGGVASAASDVYLLHATLRALLPHVELLAMFEQAMARADSRTTAVYEALVTASAAALVSEPERRIPTVATLRQRYRAIRALVADMPAPDPAALAAAFVDLLPGEVVVAIHVDNRSVRIDDVLLDLSEKGSQWRILKRLADAHAAGAAVSIEELAAAGWPDEKVLQDAARARVYVAISGLRKTALREHLLKRDDGYFLSPRIRLR